jgi:pimeloyl-ACP methyl ester carboxylesterase
MATFVLVHGAWHGAWCWERVAPLLEAAGHRTTTPNLPIDNPKAGLVEYAQWILARMPQADPVVLVGHSLGASVIPLVAARRPVRRLVLVCPVIRSPGRSLADQAEEDADMATADLETGRTMFDDASSAWQPEVAAEVFFNACDPKTASWAAGQLRRQYWRYWDEPNPLEAWPEAEYRAIACLEDRVCSIEWARRMIPIRLGFPAVEIPGDHAPFLSVPERLVEALLADL